MFSRVVFYFFLFLRCRFALFFCLFCLRFIYLSTPFRLQSFDHSSLVSGLLVFEFPVCTAVGFTLRNRCYTMFYQTTCCNHIESMYSIFIFLCVFQFG
uniref:Putative secreted peptide n=1 Tax=Anopheles braziliensis TaxID=58242 RepID=A0A2M3ZV17_9DIPT